MNYRMSLTTYINVISSLYKSFCVFKKSLDNLSIFVFAHISKIWDQRQVLLTYQILIQHTR